MQEEDDPDHRHPPRNNTMSIGQLCRSPNQRGACRHFQKGRNRFTSRWRILDASETKSMGIQPRPEKSIGNHSRHARRATTRKKLCQRNPLRGEKQNGCNKPHIHPPGQFLPEQNTDRCERCSRTKNQESMPGLRATSFGPLRRVARSETSDHLSIPARAAQGHALMMGADIHTVLSVNTEITGY
jgi:hypothetical protein